MPSEIEIKNCSYSMSEEEEVTEQSLNTSLVVLIRVEVKFPNKILLSRRTQLHKHKCKNLNFDVNSYISLKTKIYGTFWRFKGTRRRVTADRIQPFTRAC